MSLASTLTDAALLVAAAFAEPAEDLSSLQQRLTATDLSDFVREELLRDPAEIEVSATALALPTRGLSPALGRIGATTETTIEVKAPLESGEAAVEVTVSCQTEILVEHTGPQPDLGEAFTLISDDDERQIYETTKVLSYIALVTVDEFDRPIAGELISVNAPADDPGHKFWEAATRLNFDTLRGSASLAESFRKLNDVSLPPETLAAIRKLQNLSLPPETLATIKRMQDLAGGADASETRNSGDGADDAGPDDEEQLYEHHILSPRSDRARSAGTVTSSADSAHIESFWSTMQPELPDRHTWPYKGELAEATCEWFGAGTTGAARAYR